MKRKTKAKVHASAKPFREFNKKAWSDWRKEIWSEQKSASNRFSRIFAVFHFPKIINICCCFFLLNRIENSGKKDSACVFFCFNSIITKLIIKRRLLVQFENKGDRKIKWMWMKFCNCWWNFFSNVVFVLIEWRRWQQKHKNIQR